MNIKISCYWSGKVVQDFSLDFLPEYRGTCVMSFRLFHDFLFSPFLLPYWPLCCLFHFLKKSNYSWFTMLSQFLPYRKVTKSYMYTYICVYICACVCVCLYTHERDMCVHSLSYIFHHGPSQAVSWTFWPHSCFRAFAHTVPST